MTALAEALEVAPEAFVPVGLREAAVPAWRALVGVLIQLDAIGLRTPCDEDPVAFLGEDLDLRQQAAKRCGLCPIRPECGAFADANRETHGVWAGRDRTRGVVAELRRRRGAADTDRDDRSTGEDEHAFTTTAGEDDQ